MLDNDGNAYSKLLINRFTDEDGFFLFSRRLFRKYIIIVLQSTSVQL